MTHPRCSNGCTHSGEEEMRFQRASSFSSFASSPILGERETNRFALRSREVKLSRLRKDGGNVTSRLFRRSRRVRHLRSPSEGGREMSRLLDRRNSFSCSSFPMASGKEES